MGEEINYQNALKWNLQIKYKEICKNPCFEKSAKKTSKERWIKIVKKRKNEKSSTRGWEKGTIQW